MGFFNREGTRIAPPLYDTGWVYTSSFVVLSRNRLLGVNTQNGVVVLPDSCTRIKTLNSKTIAGLKKTKWGAAQESSRLLIPFEYDSIGFVSTFFAAAVRNDTVQIYTTGNTGHKAEGVYINAVPLGTFWVKVYTHSKKCAVIDTAGNIIVPPLYDDVFFSGSGNWTIVNNKKWGVVDSKGRIIVQPVYDLVQPFRNGMSVVFSGGLQGLINERGELISRMANCSISIRGNTAKVVSPGDKVEYVKTDGAGNVIQRDEYEEVRVIRIGGDNTAKGGRPRLPGAPGQGFRMNDSLPVAPRGDSLVWFFNPDIHKYGLMDSYNGDTLIPAIYSFVRKMGLGYTLVGENKVVNGVILDGKQMLSNALVGVFDDSAGKFVIRPEYARITPFRLHAQGSKTLFQCVRTDGMTGLVCADGSERTLQTSCIDRLSNGVAAFCVGGKWELSDKGECKTSWAPFAMAFSIIGKGPFGSETESKNAANLPVSHTGGKWGFLDAEGNVLIPPQYDAYEPCVAKTCIVLLGKKWGMIDTSGKTLVPFEYDFLRYVFTKTDTLVQTQVNKIQMGCIDTLGNVVIPLMYSKVLALGEERLALCNANRWAVARTNGQLITEQKYLEIRPYSEGFAAVRIGRKWGFIDTAGTEVIAPVYDDVGIFSEGMCAVKQALKWGYIGTNGQMVIAPQYILAQPFFRGVAPVRSKTGYGLISTEGKTIVKPNYSLIERVPGSVVFSYRDAGVNGLMAPSGKILTTARYNKLRDIGANRLAYQEGLYWGIMDTLGVRISNAVYDKIGVFADGLCPVSLQGQWGFVESSGRFRVTPQYRAAAQFGEGFAYVLDMRGENGFIDTTGTQQIRIQKCAGATPFTENKTIVRFVRKNQTYFSVYTRFGHRLTREEFTAALPFCHGAAPVKVGHHWGLINFSGRYLVRPTYFHMSAFQDGVSIVQHSSTFGIYTLGGTQLLPPEYDAIKAEGAVIRLQKNNGLGYLHPDGRALWPMQE
jgi:hypothetical protein